MAHRAPLTNHHADGTLCPADHKHTSSGKPLHPDCPGRAYTQAICSCGDWEMKQPGKGYVNECRKRHMPATRRARRSFAICFASTVPDAPSPAPPSRTAPGGSVPHYLTVGHLLRQFQNLDPNLPIRLAINPDFPFTHYLGTEVIVRDGKAFIVDDGQEGYLPAAVSDALAWA